jgi:hypothetical protein
VSSCFVFDVYVLLLAVLAGHNPDAKRFIRDELQNFTALALNSELRHPIASLSRSYAESLGYSKEPDWSI